MQQQQWEIVGGSEIAVDAADVAVEVFVAAAVGKGSSVGAGAIPRATGFANTRQARLASERQISRIVCAYVVILKGPCCSKLSTLSALQISQLA